MDWDVAVAASAQAALTVIAAATGLALAAKRRREEEEQAQAARVRAEAEAKTETLRREKEQAREQARMQNYLQALLLQRQPNSSPPRGAEKKIERMEEAEGAALAAARQGQATATPTPVPSVTTTPMPVPPPTPPTPTVRTSTPAPNANTPSSLSSSHPMPMSSTLTPPSSWKPRGYRDPNSIPQIPLALSRGGSIDIPHASSVIGLNLVQWGTTFSASTSIPARSLAELHEEMDGKPSSVQRSVRLGPLSLSGHRNVYGMMDYEISLTFGTKQVTASNGVTVEFSHSLAFRGESMGSGWFNRVVTFEYNYLDYTAQSDVPELPANSAQAGVYIKVVPWRLAAAAALVAAGIAAGYGVWQVLSTSPLGNPLPVP